MEYRKGGRVTPDPFNGHAYVDLGLPSGTLWATMNVGAEKETDAGLYFAWGEIQGYTAEQVGTDKQFSWSDYKFNPSGDGLTFTKYSETDGKKVLDFEDDVARTNWSGQWHMPTETQCRELLNTTYVTNTWVTNYNDSGINGRLFTSKSNGNTMFVPAAGICFNGNVNSVNENGYIWTSELDSNGITAAFNLNFRNKKTEITIASCCAGRSIRPVVG